MKAFSGAAMFMVVCLAALTLQADAALDAAKLKRPLSGYFTWLKDNRKSIKGKNVAEVSKKAGEMWKSLSAEKKKVFEDQAVKAKKEYAAYIAKVKDTDAFKAYKEKLAVARKKKLKRSVKSAMRKVKMDASLKRPLSGYMLWFKDTRKSIKGKNIAEVGKKAGEMWKSLPADKKKTYADRALEAKKKYSAYVATGKGAAALKAYKEGIAKAKAPLVAKDENLKAKKAAKKAKAKAKAAAKKEKVAALKAKAKAKAVAKKAAKAAKKEKAKAAKAAKTKKVAAAKAAKAAKAKAKKAAKAKAAEAKKAAKAKKAAAAKAKKLAKKTKKVARKAKPAKTKKAKAVKKAKKPVKKAKKLIEFVPNVSTPVVVVLGLMSCGAIAMALFKVRHSVSNPSQEPLLV